MVHAFKQDGNKGMVMGLFHYLASLLLGPIQLRDEDPALLLPALKQHLLHPTDAYHMTGVQRL